MFGGWKEVEVVFKNWHDRSVMFIASLDDMVLIQNSGNSIENSDAYKKVTTNQNYFKGRFGRRPDRSVREIKNIKGIVREA